MILFNLRTFNARDVALKMPQSCLPRRRKLFLKV